MNHARGSLSEAKVLAFVAGVLAGCGGSSGPGPDAALPMGVDASGGSGPDAAPPAGADAADGPANLCVNIGSPAICASQPGLASVTDLSGTWVLETIGAQTVKVPAYANPFHLKSIGVILVQVTQTGNDVTLQGHYCDRIQQDDPNNPAKVIVIDAWRLTAFPVQRSGTFAPDNSGQWTFTLPTFIEVAGAALTNPACDPLPTDASDLVHLVDSDNDGFPGISVGLSGLITGTLRSVQRQATALHGLAVAADRIEGGMAFESDQTIVASDPPGLKTLYASSTASTDPAPCSSSFVMVKVSDGADAGAVDCVWVRSNEVTLLGM